MKKWSRSRTESRFPPTIFITYFLTLLLMSGMHQGLVVLINERGWGTFVAVAIPLVYWGLVAALLTLYARGQIVNTYDKPMRELAAAAKKVAQGDFSVYIPPLHTTNRHDYLDKMLLDFNKMVEELGSIETMRTDFVANVSHEIKTPLAIIQTNAQLLQNPQLPAPQREECAAVIVKNTKRLSALVSNILKLNKLESRQITPSLARYDLCAQLCSCALLFEPVWEQKQIDFEADLQDRAYIVADESLMELVWNNLLSNAFKFTGPGGRVTLRQSADAKAVTVSVSDSGCGIAPEACRHIFDKFYQADTSHATEGNGLGLALAQRVLCLMGAEIAVESALGQGTTFTVRIPLRDEPLEEEEEEAYDEL